MCRNAERAQAESARVNVVERTRIEMARPARLELATSWFVVVDSATALDNTYDYRVTPPWAASATQGAALVTKYHRLTPRGDTELGTYQRARRKGSLAEDQSLT